MHIDFYCILIITLSQTWFCETFYIDITRIFWWELFSFFDLQQELLFKEKVFIFANYFNVKGFFWDQFRRVFINMPSLAPQFWTLSVRYAQCVPCQNVCLTTNITEWYPCWYGTAKFAQSQVLTHSIFAFEKEVSCRDRKKSYNRYFTASPAHCTLPWNFFHGGLFSIEQLFFLTKRIHCEYLLSDLWYYWNVTKEPVRSIHIFLPTMLYLFFFFLSSEVFMPILQSCFFII